MSIPKRLRRLVAMAKEYNQLILQKQMYMEQTYKKKIQKTVKTMLIEQGKTDALKRCLSI